ncbi:hypothetical protein I2700191B6_02780 [Dorea formicigenerans]|uniref:COG1361 S-layer family protein n=1 Tax=Dorea formicigenerans TaxID=39486 RepID=UPI0036F2FC80
MTKSRRVMAVIVAALLIVAMILPGLVVKAEAAEKPKEKPKVEISLVGDIQMFEAGETKTLTLQITNKSGQELKNVEVAPDMSEKKAGDWPFVKDWKQYSEKIDSVADGESKSVSFDFTRREGTKKSSYTIPFSVYVQGSDDAIVTDPIFVYAKNETVTPDPTPGDNSQNQGDAGNGSAAGSGSDSAVAYSGGGDGGSSSESGSVPRVIVTGFDTNPAEVHAGSDFTLTIHLKNTSKKTKVQNMLFELQAPTEGSDEQTSAPAFLPTSGSNSIYLNGIKADGTADISITLNAKADLLQKPYSINLSMKYEDSQATQIESSSSISIPVKQDARFEFSEFEISPQTIEVGGETNVMCSLYNLGRIKLYNAKARFEGNGIKKQEIFIGNVDAGATGSIDAMLQGEKVTNGNSKITMTLSYEDESGNISETTKDFELEVTEAVDDSDMYMNTDGDAEAGSSGFPVVPVVVVIVIIAGVVAAVVFVKKKKKKQMLNEEEELLDELDRSSEDEREQP